MKIFLFTLLLLLLALQGCATKANEVVPKQVSPDTLLEYNTYSCEKLEFAHNGLEEEIKKMKSIQNENANKDKWLAAAGVITYGITLFYVGDDEATKKLQITLGQMEAIKAVSLNKKCGEQAN